MESIVVIVGFLGAGKTTLLKHLIESYIKAAWEPYVVLNDYVDADLDAEQIAESFSLCQLKALNGNCICCDGIGELRESVNNIPEREKGITLIEANGTSDACRLMGFLGVGLNERFKPPIQISVVDVKNWQRRGYQNELESNQIQVSSLVVLSHVENVPSERVVQVMSEVKRFSPHASIVTREQLDALLLPELEPAKNEAVLLDHKKTHWASSSIDLPDLLNLKCVKDICDSLPASILRVKGCTRVGKDKRYTYFERCPDGEVYVRPYRGTPSTGPKLLTVGPGSDPDLLQKTVERYV